MRIRLKDIAKDLNLSTVTVSKVLRGVPEISEKTRERVLKRMQELNYQPNMLARGLASGRSFTIGLVVPDLIHPFFAEFAKALSGALREHQYALLLASSDEDPRVEVQEIATLLNRGVDVLLLASCQPELQPLPEAAITPMILVDRNYSWPNAQFVGSDDVAAGILATEHLYATGKRRIAHLAGGVLSPAQQRLEGYGDVLHRVGLPYREEFVVPLDSIEDQGAEAGYRGMQQLLALQQRPDAVFCYNDQSALGAMEAAVQAGFSIPGDIAFVGCGNLRYSNYLRTPLTSIDHRVMELGAAAGKLALALMKRGGERAASVLLEPQLVVRASSVTTGVTASSLVISR